MKKHLAAVFATTMLLSTPAALAQAPINDPKLAQTVTDQENIAPLGTTTVIESGHADLGPMLVDKNFEFLVRDDSKEKPVWRHIEDVVFPVGEKAQLTLPQGGEFDFTGARAGEKVWVVPQTEIPGVVWLGWNTQHPTIRSHADRGVTMNFLGHQGPGQYTLFLQAGGFAKPQQLFSSANTSEQAQQMWVDVNTHTHANWVFTEPGVHLIALEVVMKQVDGTEVRDTKVLKFAVGNTEPSEAAAAKWQGELPTAKAAQQEKKQAQSADIALWVGLGLLGVAILLGVGAWVMSNSAKKRRQAAERS